MNLRRTNRREYRFESVLEKTAEEERDTKEMGNINTPGHCTERQGWGQCGNTTDALPAKNLRTLTVARPMKT